MNKADDELVRCVTGLCVCVFVRPYHSSLFDAVSSLDDGLILGTTGQEVGLLSESPP